MSTNRNQSIDALRGLAIIGMILSGAIAFGGILPAWMYHAQVPPPLHKFNGELAGITWVDLVFPFFLFSMGAAIPFSIQKIAGQENFYLATLKTAFKRYVALLFFALFSNHMKYWVISDKPTVIHHLLSILAFVLLALLFTKLSFAKKIYAAGIKVAALLLAIFLLLKLPFWNGLGFQLNKGDIILVVLANMAFFGNILYAITIKNPIYRLAILPVILAVFLSSTESNVSWTKLIFTWNKIGEYKIEWAYQFYFLKYLFIVIPGTFIGEWILKYREFNWQSNALAVRPFIAVVAILLVVGNTIFLFTRQLTVNILFTLCTCAMLLFLFKKYCAGALMKNLIYAAIYLLLLGLCFEAYQAGIKKDSSTYSYYFVTTGLSIFCIIALSIAEQFKWFKAIVRNMALVGQNPMVAYVAGSLLLLPIMQLLQIKPYWDSMNQNVLMGLLKGLIFTGAVIAITIFFVKRKWFWKT
jgi:predicted acyltransferase